ncbi:uroporphyrinogen-III C-methyltransferase [Ostreiculturibacter nitratireducens]|uniref:uroporphyrinogen-III C-methyltransferase n=1 Tax=Ostreiculturibacter nitratireducens TaxID=3075226 RepID=UPI0031B5E892
MRQTTATLAPAPGHVVFVGAGPGDPELLTLRAARALAEADIVLHDRLVGEGVLALAGAQATLVETGKEGFGPSMLQEDITAMILAFARAGRNVIRLKSGDPGVFGRLDEETEALAEAGIAYTVVPGITAASAAAAEIGQSLTRRGRNGSLRILTGHDVSGFAEQDWKSLARGGEVAAIYMGKKAARFLQGRLMMHGAAPETPVTLVENASRADQRIRVATLADLPAAAEGLGGPAVILFGLAPRAANLSALPAVPDLKEAL